MKKIFLYLIPLAAIALLGGCANSQNPAKTGSSVMSVRFLNRDQAAKFLSTPDALSQRLGRFSLECRMGRKEATVEDYLRLAAGQACEWEQRQLDAVNGAVDSINSVVRRKEFKLDFPKEIDFLLTTMEEEGGAGGYTRGTNVVLSPDYINPRIVAHELFHILTRANPEFREQMYSLIGFTVLPRSVELPQELKDCVIENPDVNAHDSYATFTVNGEKKDCMMFLYSDRAYEGGSLWKYFNVGLLEIDPQECVPVCKDGKYNIYSVEQAEDFYEKVGRNTDYVIDPEEVLADNFSYIFAGSRDTIPNPELLYAMEMVCRDCYYKGRLAKIAADAGIPMIQLESLWQGNRISLQIENPAYYGCVSGVSDATCPQYVFQAASLSKVVFSYIVMRMLDRGEIDLDRPLCEYTGIERFEDREMASRLTARMVLHHRSGLGNWSVGPSSSGWPQAPIAFRYPADSCFSYSGEAFSLLQRAVEAIRGKGIEEIAREEVFEPLRMDHTSYGWLPSYDSLAVDGYYANGEVNGREKFPRENVAYTLRSTARDYARFLEALLKGEGLSAASAARMMEPDVHKAVRYAGHERPCDSFISWGLGIGTERHPQLGKVCWHWGDNGNYKNLFILLPKQEAYLVYFTNSSHGHEIIGDVTSLIFKGCSPFALDEWINVD